MTAKYAIKQAAEVDAVAEVYALSLFELASGIPAPETEDSSAPPNVTGTAIEQNLAELQAIVTLANENSRFHEFLHSKIISIKDRRASLKIIFANEMISDLIMRFLLVLNDKGRLGHIMTIARAYELLYLKHIGKIEVEATSAEPMDEQMLETVRKEIQNALGKDPIINNTLDESLIGGLKLRIGDKLIDASVASRLKQLRHALIVSGSDAVRNKFPDMIDQ